ncbi:MAG: preprotein translocase subunit SecE [Planctomycetes bacterium]|nr:preprotein translocase subunit SecE [Planctomycetota bacterium]
MVIWSMLSVYIAISCFNEWVDVDENGGNALAFGIAFVVLVAMEMAGFFVLFIKKGSADYFIHVNAEVNKVVWPDWPTVKTNAGQVVVVMAFFMVSLFLMDYILQYLRQIIY